MLSITSFEMTRKRVHRKLIVSNHKCVELQIRVPDRKRLCAIMRPAWGVDILVRMWLSH